jgi:hypothetical protein
VDGDASAASPDLHGDGLPDANAGTGDERAGSVEVSDYITV